MYKIDTLKDQEGNTIYPVTETDAIYDSEGNRLDNTLSSINQNLSDLIKSKLITINTDSQANGLLFQNTNQTVLTAYTLNNYIAIPFFYSANTSWYVKIIDAAGNPISNTSNIQVYLQYTGDSV